MAKGSAYKFPSPLTLHDDESTSTIDDQELALLKVETQHSTNKAWADSTPPPEDEDTTKGLVHGTDTV